MKQIVVRVRELEAEVAELRRSYLVVPRKEVANTTDRKRVQAILARTAGAWKDAKLDPVAWQRKARKAWGTRLKKQRV